MKQRKYYFSPTLLDQFCNLRNSDAVYEKYYGMSENPQITSEEFYEQKYREIIDRINDVKTPTTEAQAKGTCLNEIVDCIIKKRATSSSVYIKTIREQEDLYNALYDSQGIIDPDRNYSEILDERCREILSKIGQQFIYARDGEFEFFFDIPFCKSIAEYFSGCLCQFYTAADLETSKGMVEIHGYLDYFRRKSIYDLKTCKSYTFGNYGSYNQRHAYPYCMIKSGMMTDVQDVEFTAYKLTGGNSRTPLITGEQYREVYTFDWKQSVEVLTENCERFIEFLENNMENINLDKTRIFGGNRHE